MRYLLDTHICIFIIRNRPPVVRARFKTLRPGEVGISAVTEAELLYGAHQSGQVEHNLAAVLDFSAQMEVVAFDSQVTDVYGRLRTHLERRGTPIGPLDLQIAATALAHDLPLVTNNTREFQRVPDLRLEDWTPT